MATAISVESLKETNVSLRVSDEQTGEQQITRPARLYHYTASLDATPFLTPDSLRIFRAAGYLFKTARSWIHLLESAASEEIEVMFLDIDMIDHAMSRKNISSQRLVTLLNKVERNDPLTIAGITNRDFYEIEDTVRAGIDAIIPSSTSAFTMIHRIEAARRRKIKKITAGNLIERAVS